MTPYEVAVPSYKRPQRLLERTLTALSEGGVPPRLITVYTHDHDPHSAAYLDATRAMGVRHEQTGARGIIQQRRTIADSYPPGTNLVTLDDDVTGLERLTPDGRGLRPLPDLHGFFQSMFERTREERLTAWGLAPVRNPFFMKPTVTTDLKFLIYTCVGFITDPGHPAQVNTVRTKDDYEHSIRRWWWDGGVVRANGVVANAAVYTGSGGLQGAPERGAAPTEEAVRQLEQQWPGVIRRNSRRKGALPEILLNPKRRHGGHPYGALPPGLKGESDG